MVANGSHVHHDQFGDGTVIMLMGGYALVDFPSICMTKTRTVALTTLSEC